MGTQPTPSQSAAVAEAELKAADLLLRAAQLEAEDAEAAKQQLAVTLAQVCAVAGGRAGSRNGGRGLRVGFEAQVLASSRCYLAALCSDLHAASRDLVHPHAAPPPPGLVL